MIYLHQESSINSLKEPSKTILLYGLTIISRLITQPSGQRKYWMTLIIGKPYSLKITSIHPLKLIPKFPFYHPLQVYAVFHREGDSCTSDDSKALMKVNLNVIIHLSH